MLPEHMEVYKTLTFGAGSIPKGLGKAHQLKAQTWGRLTVLVGSLVYVDEPTGSRQVLIAGEHVIIEPERKHHIEYDAKTEIQIEFLHEVAH